MKTLARFGWAFVSLCLVACGRRNVNSFSIPIVEDRSLTAFGAWREQPVDSYEPSESSPNVQSDMVGFGETMVAVTSKNNDRQQRLQFSLRFSDSERTTEVLVVWYEDSEGVPEYATSLRGIVRIDKCEFPSPEQPRVMEYDLTGLRGVVECHFTGKVLITRDDLVAKPTPASTSR